MSIALSTFSSLKPSKKCALKFSSQTSVFPCAGSHFSPFHSSLTHLVEPLKFQLAHNRSGIFGRKVGFLVDKNHGFFRAKVANDSGEEKQIEQEDEDFDLYKDSTLPERFRTLTKEAPDKPVIWPWFIPLPFMIYAWRTVFWELSNWRNTVLAIIGSIIGFFQYISKWVLALTFYLIGDQLTWTIRCIETAFYSIRAFYSGIVAYAPVQELTTIIILVSAVLSVAEAAMPDSVNSQPYLLTVASLIGFAAVGGYITELFFWILLVGLFGFARLVKKRDYVSSALPVATVLVAVGEPWVRFAAMCSFVGLTILYHSKKPVDGEKEVTLGTVRQVPIPLLCAGLAIGIRLAAKWAGYRHLTWMIV